MAWKDKLKNYVEAKQAQMRRGIEVTEQMKAEKLRKRMMRVDDLGPGTIRYGLAHKQSVGEFMRDALERRRSMRKAKQKDEDD